MQYCLGFVFSTDKNRILLQLKKKPIWQENRYNGIGGKLEEAETPTLAMKREAYEETGIKTRWIPKGQMIVNGHDIFLYAAFVSDLELLCAEQFAKRNAKESVSTFWITELPKNILGNLAFLIPMCLDENFGTATINMEARS